MHRILKYGIIAPEDVAREIDISGIIEPVHKKGFLFTTYGVASGFFKTFVSGLAGASDMDAGETEEISVHVGNYTEWFAACMQSIMDAGIPNHVNDSPFAPYRDKLKDK